jgi:hypothetical protein
VAIGIFCGHLIYISRFGILYEENLATLIQVIIFTLRQDLLVFTIGATCQCRRGLKVEIWKNINNFEFI